MELEELKASWNALDKRLAETEIVNMRMVKEMIQQKTKSAYDHIVGHNVYNLVVCILIICGVFPYVYMNTPIRTLSSDSSHRSGNSLCCRSSIGVARTAVSLADWYYDIRRCATRRKSGR